MTDFDLESSLVDALAPPAEHAIGTELDPASATDVNAPWHIEDDQTASWALRKMAHAQAVYDEHERKVAAFYEQEAAKLIAWRESMMNVVRTEQRTVAFMDAHLRAYLGRMRDADEKAGREPRTSINVPGGKVTCSRSQALLVLDPVALVRWAYENGYSDVMLKPPEPSVSGIKDRLLRDGDGKLSPRIAIGETGEVLDVPGVAVDVRENYAVKPA